MIGRQDQLREVRRHADSRRLVTLTGPGGIGKTRLALAVAPELPPDFPDGVWLVEFSPLADPGLVPATVAAVAGLEFADGGEMSAQRVAQALAGRRLLLVLDTCEHVIGVAAELAEAALQAGPALSVIATSREPLRADGEQIYPVPPLALPAEGDDPWQCGAVRLFAARSRAAGAKLPKDRHAGLALATICRRLDGIPLAIELAAARASTLGIAETARRLDDRFHLLAGGRRTALPRHQTLRAALDWSHDLLPEAERIILRRVAVFAGVFNPDAATAIVAGPEGASSQVVEGMSDLVANSMVCGGSGNGVARFRLLDTMRAYALEKLIESGEADVLAHMDFPAQHRTKIHSTNPLERLNKEVKRRADVVGIFPNEGAIIRLIGAVLLEANDEWQLQHRYMQTEAMAELTPTLIDAVPTQIATMVA